MPFCLNDIHGSCFSSTFESVLPNAGYILQHVDGFKYGADVMIDQFLGNDALVWPIIFCCRHALELEPKEILWLGFVVTVTWVRSIGDEYTSTVEVPEAFPYLMMKLHAFADRKEDEEKDLGRHHALDAYSIVGMMTEPEYERAKRIGLEQSQNPNVKRARAIVEEDFCEETGIGILRMREHGLFSPDFPLDEFRQVLQKMFPDGGQTSAGEAV